MSRKDVLDKGYVRLVDSMGNDLSIVNAARVSYAKEVEKLTAKDKRLLAFLIENGHTSPLRHATLTFEVYAPLLVMRQWSKYRVGSHWSFEDSTDSIETWNESSRRYITEKEEFYIPDVWRSAPENSKQGSGEPVDDLLQQSSVNIFNAVVGTSANYYKWLLSKGVCAEQARLVLPAYALYVRARWTVSLQGVIHFLSQRLEHDAQWEIQQYARAVRDLTQPLFPETFKLLEIGKHADLIGVA